MSDKIPGVDKDLLKSALDAFTKKRGYIFNFFVIQEKDRLFCNCKDFKDFCTEDDDFKKLKFTEGKD